MNRELKFKVWNSSDEREIAGFMDFDFPNGDVFDETGRYSFLSVLNGDFPDIKVMQYTGMKDHNDVEVYEGDILTSHLVGQQPEVVVFEDGCFYLTKPQTRTLYDELNSYNGFRVIGNIFENEDLLK